VAEKGFTLVGCSGAYQLRYEQSGVQLDTVAHRNHVVVLGEQLAETLHCVNLLVPARLGGGGGGSGGLRATGRKGGVDAAKHDCFRKQSSAEVATVVQSREQQQQSS
jgi:hypothetical protein